MSVWLETVHNILLIELENVSLINSGRDILHLSWHKAELRVEVNRLLERTVGFEGDGPVFQSPRMPDGPFQDTTAQAPAAYLRDKIHLPEFASPFIQGIQAVRAEQIPRAVFHDFEDPACAYVIAFNVIQVGIL